MLHMLVFLLVLLLRFLLGLLLLTLLLLLLVLFIPFRYRLSGHRYDEDIAVEGSADWLFGLVSVVFTYDRVHGIRLRLMLFFRWVLKSFKLTKDREWDGKGSEQAKTKNGKVEATNKKEAINKKEEATIKKAEARKKKKEEDRMKKKNRKKFILTRAKLFILAHTGILVLKKTMPHQVFLHCRIGFDDPADTGTFCAVLAPMQAIFRGNPEKYNIRILPVFEDAEATGRIDIQGRIIIWFIVWEALKLAISRPFRQDIFGYLKPHRAITQGGYEHV